MDQLENFSLVFYTVKCFALTNSLTWSRRPLHKSIVLIISNWICTSALRRFQQLDYWQ